MNSQTICIRIDTGARFVGFRGGIQCHCQGDMFSQCIAYLHRSQPLRLRVGTDEVEIGVGGVGLGFAGRGLLCLELIEDPLTAGVLHVVPQFLASAVTVAVLRLRGIEPPEIIK